MPGFIYRLQKGGVDIPLHSCEPLSAHLGFWALHFRRALGGWALLPAARLEGMLSLSPWFPRAVSLNTTDLFPCISRGQN